MELGVAPGLVVAVQLVVCLLWHLEGAAGVEAEERSVEGPLAWLMRTFLRPLRLSLPTQRRSVPIDRFGEPLEFIMIENLLCIIRHPPFICKCHTSVTHLIGIIHLVAIIHSPSSI